MIGVIGDAFTDEWVFGTVERVSPEADCLVLKHQATEQHPGGASHVIHAIKKMGAEVQGICPRYGWKGRFVGRQQILRVDQEETEAIPAADEDLWVESVKRWNAQILVLSDYNKGTFKGNLAAKLIALGIPTIVDPKGPWERYAGASVITPNTKELAGANPQKLIEEYNFGAVLETRGADGMHLYTRGGSFTPIPPHKVNAVDVTGAGDVVVAALAVKLSERWDIVAAAEYANEMAAKSTEKWGTR